MKMKSAMHLLRIGQLISQRQWAIQRSFKTFDDIFEREMQLIHEIVLLYTRFVRAKDDDEQVTEGLRRYFEEEITLKELITFIQSLKTKRDITMEIEASREKWLTEVVNKLFELKYLLQLKRHQLGNLYDCERKSIRYEKRILGIALQELGGRRYFKEHFYTVNP